LSVVSKKRASLKLLRHITGRLVRELELAEEYRGLALFNMAIDSKLRGCNLVCLKIAEVFVKGQVKDRASIVKCKTQKADPV